MPSRYQDFHLQPLAGEWREGSSDKLRPVLNPYSGEELVSIRLANSEDLDKAYRMAQATQQEWANRAPSERSGVLLRAVSIFDERKEEIIDWLIRESGSTRLKAMVEWGSARAITQEAASMPARAHGYTMASDIPGKESLVYRRPLGVVGVIKIGRASCR